MATLIAPSQGGTGVNNGTKTITLGGNLTTSGAFNTTLTETADTNVTLPTSGTLATLAGSEALTNKIIVAGSNTIIFRISDSNAAFNYSQRHDNDINAITIISKKSFGITTKGKKIMKKIITIGFLILSLYPSAQTGIYAWTANPTAARIHTYKLNGYDGVRIIAPWYTLQPTENNLSFSILKNMIKQVSDSGLNMELHIWAGPDAPIFGGTNWLVGLGVGTFTTTGGNDNGPWPDYYNATYISAYNTLHHALADTLYNLPTDQKDHLKSVFISSSSTGDLQPYKGTPSGSTFGIANNDGWRDYYRNQWATVYQYYQKDTGFMHTTFNPGNSAENLDYCLNAFPHSYLKHGDVSHTYPLDGETYILNWPTRIFIGEVDDDIKTSNNPSTKFQMLRSAISTHTSRLDFFDVWNDSAFVPSLVSFFHKYVTQFDPETANKGFCALAGKINFLNTTDYPVSSYGDLWDNTSRYNRSVYQIDSSSADTLRKQMRYVQTAILRKNNTRLSNLENTGAQYHPDGPYYNNDIAFYTVPNYSLNISQLLISQTSSWLYRIDAGSIYGRNAAKAKNYQGRTALYFDVDDNLISTPENDTVTFTVTYKDEGTATWEIQCYKCLTKSIHNQNSGQWLQVSLTANHFKKGNLMRNGADLIIEVKKGNAFPIDMVEVDNSSK